MFSSYALSALRDCLKNNIAYAQYKVGGTYYKSDIRSAYVMDDGRLAITFLIDHTLPGTITVTEVQLYDYSGRLWCSKVESITRKAMQEGILYRFAFTVSEG